ncbi:MAG: hypothetical protein NTZ22_03085 [Hyphomicrobiales bacterium]|nr:hypothetical protein [Hyphomicrobiales bacterium]
MIGQLHRRGNQQIGIFEITQHGQQDENTRAGDAGAPPSCRRAPDPLPAQQHHHRHRQQHHDETGIPCGVKQQAGQGQKRLARRIGLAQQPGDRPDTAKKHGKFSAWEQHLCAP